MTREEIIAMAREVGFTGYDSLSERLHEFAALVAAAEREACAAFLEGGVNLAGLAGDPMMQVFTGKLLMGCAESIRARGQV